MKKRTMKQWMTAAAMMLGLLVTTAMVTSCSDKDTEAYAIDVETQDPEATTEPTEDQLTTKVTADLEAAVIGTPAEGSVGAALVKRLPEVYNDISVMTDLVLICGSELGTLSKSDLEDAAFVYLSGGYVGLLEPTLAQAGQFFDDFEAAIETVEAQLLEERFDIDEETAAAAARHSMTSDRLQTRAANMQAIATRAGANAGDDRFAELFICGQTAYFMQDPMDEELTSIGYMDDGEGNATEAETVTTKVERTAYQVGLRADAAAQWLNETEKANEEAGADADNAPMLKTTTRADASRAINDLMNASETFTFSGDINTIDKNEYACYYNCVNATVRSWGIHNFTSNKDYYYVKENVTVSMYRMFFPTKDSEDTWYKTTNFGEYNYWYGSFLSQYTTSMDLSGSGGSIQLEAATPETDNYTSTTSVVTSSTHSVTETSSITWGFSFGTTNLLPALMASIGGTEAVGVTNSNTFSMGSAKPQKDLGVAKNTNGTRVEWTYKGNLPKYYEKHENNYIWHCHEKAADILTNDANLTNEVCWSVANPQGQYTLNIESTPQTASLLLNDRKKGQDGKYLHTYNYWATPKQNYSHTLLQPNRVMLTWRTQLTIDEWADGYQAGAKDKLEAKLKEKFPDMYRDVLKITAKDTKDLSLANAYFQYMKNIYAAQKDLLIDIARDLGIQKFSINWRCDDQSVGLRDPFTVDASYPEPEKPNLVPQVFWCENSRTLYFVNALAQEKGSTWNNDAITTVYDSNVVTDWMSNYDKGWTTNDVKSKLTRVVFDKSFIDVKPNSTKDWFRDAPNLKTIEGLEYLNTSEVRIANYMFAGCKSLTVLDVSNFDVGKVQNARCMFAGCTSLTTIYCNQTWNIEGDNMFYNSKNLRGAVSYNEDKTDAKMANPKTGYFSVKQEDTSNLPTIYLKDKQKNTTLIQQYEGQKVNAIYSRALTADKTADGQAVPTPWTVCLPYDFDLTARVQSGQVSIYTLAAVENGEFVFVKLTDTKLTAGVPYVVMVNSGRVPLRAQGVTISATKPASLKVYNSVSAWRNKIGSTIGYWTGTFDLLDADYAAGVGAFAMQPKDRSWNFYDPNGKATIPAFRAYLTSTSIDEQVYKARYE